VRCYIEYTTPLSNEKNASMYFIMWSNIQNASCSNQAGFNASNSSGFWGGVEEEEEAEDGEEEEEEEEGRGRCSLINHCHTVCTLINHCTWGGRGTAGVLITPTAIETTIRIISYLGGRGTAGVLLTPTAIETTIRIISYLGGRGTAGVLLAIEQEDDRCQKLMHAYSVQRESV
jgi:hypothetical protein